MQRLFFLALPLLAGAVAAQSSVVIPSAAATTRPATSPFYTNLVFYSTSSTTIPHDSRTQSIVDVADVGVPSAVWNSISTRRPQGLGNANPAMTTTATIVLSVSPNAWSAASNTFATNTGPNATTVMTGQVSLPAETNPGSWPAPWQTPIPFSTPFVFVAATGQSLVIDVSQTGNSATTPWYVEMTSPDSGGRVSNPSSSSSCRFSNNTYNSGLSYTTGGLNPNGGTWYVQYNNLLPNTSGVAWLGMQGVGGMWGSLSLPFDLTSLGAPGCSINASVDIVVPLTATNTSARWPNVTIPPGYGGTSFFDHSIWLDPAANALGAVVGWSSRWNIGTGIGAPGAMLSATGNSAGNPTGSLVPGRLPTWQLNP
jgi:hypothetical protein